MNWNGMSIGKKICIGFGTVLTTLAVVAIWSVVGIGGIVQNADEVIKGNQLRGEMVQREVDHLNWANQVNALLTDNSITELHVETDPHKCAFGEWYYSDARLEAEKMVPELKAILAEIEEPHNHLHESAITIGETFSQADLGLGDFLRDAKTAHLQWAHTVKDAFIDTSIKKIDAESDPRKCAFGKWYYSAEVRDMRRADHEFDRHMSAIEDPHNKLHESLDRIQAYIDNGNRSKAVSHYKNVTKPLAYETLAKIDSVLAWHNEKVEGMKLANSIYANETKVSLEKVQELIGQVNETVEKNVMTDKEMLRAAMTTKFAVIILSVIAGILGIVLAIFIARGIIHALTRVMEGLSAGSSQVAAASRQVSGSSQQMAEGASEQASSLEEISSSLEEMSSMTRQNADNAKQADTMADNTRTTAERGTTAMKKMAEAIEKIKSSSDETAKIVKTIDEIAFQTNLLALNAAVEAARAGEAGMGFAVVAEEVRNLAQRSAEAAKDTAELIEGSRINADNGVAVTHEVDEILGEISINVNKMTELIGEVSAASDEQSQGISQVTTAVGQMDKVTQSSAANAEESASASEELSSQALELNEMVAALATIVKGDGAERTKLTQIAEPTPMKHLAGNGAGWNGSGREPKPATVGRIATTVSPSDVIPLDEEDFDTF